ncbi:hydrogen gas-evolving membrane-bound hydrogenase subunit E [Plantactinospora sp. WMMB334]|uniref:hydrogen gas-evolving membrane-bound hydrogenase subunit E n=1 Tax=Plantactinospora sp. WMMB334 TaxID=3404119 RepID=UPI003B94C2A8
MAVVLGLHVLVAVACAGLVRRWGARVLALGAVAPAIGFGWLLSAAPDVLAGRERRISVAWAPTLRLELPLRLDALALLLGLIITGVGTVVLLYGVRYFAGRRRGLGQTAVVLVLFAGVMLALVLADHLLALYVAWELTTVCSFLLIADGGRHRAARRAALRALLVTSGAGFVMLLGLVLLGQVAGDYRISGLLAAPPRGPAVTVAVMLILVGAVAKSAQVPFHPWLPEAMVAPTPVSGYLHAAAMVKAGVYLVARLAPGFADVPGWRPVVLAVGLTTMLLGGIRALTQTDLKRLLAFGTLAQLGFILVLVGAGTRTAALAGTTILLAHALFKATLFLVVGIVDHEAGTRDLRELSGVGRRAPGLALVALLACLSMVGLPPTVGYLGKEAAFEAFVAHGPGQGWVLAGLAVGSALTAAYTVRFLWGAFADRAGVPSRLRHVPVPWLLTTAVCAVAGLVLGCVPAVAGAPGADYAAAYPAAAGGYRLALWHGVGLPLGISLLTLVAGVLLHLGRRPLVPVATWIRQHVVAALAVQDRLASGVMTGARILTVRTQVGSLPRYLLVTMSVLVLGPGFVLLAGAGVPLPARAWDEPAQAVLGLGLVAGVLALVMARRRLVVPLLLSAVGYLVAGLFVLHGAPDLALAQLLVETLTLVLFVLVVRRMPPRTRHAQPPSRFLRAGIAVLVGAFVTGATLVATARHVPSRSTEGYFREASPAGGPNVVNVILTEFRALDTLGEVTVLAVASTGIAGLVMVSRRGTGPRRLRVAPGRHRRAAGNSGKGPG